MGLIGRLFGASKQQPSSASSAALLPAPLLRAIDSLPGWMLARPSSHPPAEGAALSAGMDTFMRWERLFQAACCGNCALSLGAMRLLTEAQKAAAIQRVFAVVERVDSGNLGLMQGFMDYAVKRFQENEAPEMVIGAWLLQSAADVQPGSPQLRELASSSDMQRLHGTLVMNLTREWGREFLAS